MNITIDAQAFDAQLAHLESTGATDLFLTSRGASHIRRAFGAEVKEICASPTRFALAMLIDHIAGAGTSQRLQESGSRDESGVFKGLRFSASATGEGQFALVLRLNAPKPIRAAAEALATN